MFEPGARSYLPRDLYGAYLAQSDVFIGLHWQRYGRVALDLGAERFDQAFSAGFRLSQREAVTAARDQRTGAP